MGHLRGRDTATFRARQEIGDHVPDLLAENLLRRKITPPEFTQKSGAQSVPVSAASALERGDHPSVGQESF
ncbi:hypothetical protein [Amycolatopsis sp. cmx-11-51]|uniref:hypothetical protein n=1 Tax=unclassified Amycolatopsis TaxID=2618356 RepID=UPI0039E359E0